MDISILERKCVGSKWFKSYIGLGPLEESRELKVFDGNKRVLVCEQIIEVQNVVCNRLNKGLVFCSV